MIAKKQIIYDSDFGQVFIVTRRTEREGIAGGDCPFP